MSYFEQTARNALLINSMTRSNSLMNARLSSDLTLSLEKRKSHAKVTSSKNLDKMVRKSSDIYKYGGTYLLEAKKKMRKAIVRLENIKIQLEEREVIMASRVVPPGNYFHYIFKDDAKDALTSITGFSNAIGKVADPDKFHSISAILTEANVVSVKDIDKLLGKATDIIIKDSLLVKTMDVFEVPAQLGVSKMYLDTSIFIEQSVITGVYTKSRGIDFTGYIPRSRSTTLFELEKIVSVAKSTMAQLEDLMLAIPKIFFEGFKIGDLNANDGKLNKEISAIVEDKEELNLLLMHLTAISDVGVMGAVMCGDFIKTIDSYARLLENSTQSTDS